jgi:hypothetical protein
MKSCKGVLNENKTYNRIDIAGSGRSGCPAKCRDRDCKVFALAVFTTAGTHEPCVHGGGGCSRATFWNRFSRKIEDHQVIILSQCTACTRITGTCNQANAKQEQCCTAFWVIAGKEPLPRTQRGMVRFIPRGRASSSRHSLSQRALLLQ